MRPVDADVLIKRLNDLCNINCPYTEKQRPYMCGSCLLGCAEEAVEDAPTIKPKRKKGKWIKVNGKTAINCSACYHCSWSLSFEDTVKRFNFCPNCGSKMEEGE